MKCFNASGIKSRASRYQTVRAATLADTKVLAVLFEDSVPTINEHLANLYSKGEIAKGSTIRNFGTVQKEGNRDVTRNMDFYNIEASTCAL
jgi:hypothetical protein